MTEPRPRKERRSTGQLRELLQRYSDRGHPLSHVSALVGRQPSAIRRYASKLKLSFSDYTPR